MPVVAAHVLVVGAAARRRHLRSAGLALEHGRAPARRSDRCACGDLGLGRIGLRGSLAVSSVEQPVERSVSSVAPQLDARRASCAGRWWASAARRSSSCSRAGWLLEARDDRRARRRRRRARARGWPRAQLALGPARRRSRPARRSTPSDGQHLADVGGQRRARGHDQHRCGREARRGSV